MKISDHLKAWVAAVNTLITAVVVVVIDNVIGLGRVGDVLVSVGIGALLAALSGVAVAATPESVQRPTVTWDEGLTPNDPRRQDSER